MNKIRLCILAEDFYPIVHGATRQLMQLGSGLVREGHDVLVITRKINPGDATKEVIDGYKVVRVPPAWGSNRFGKYAMLGPALWSCISHRAQYDFLLVSDVKALGPVGILCSKFLGKICLLRAGTCGEIDGSYAYMYDASPSRSKVALAKSLAWARKLFLRRADGFLSISSAIGREIALEGIPTNRIFEFPNGVDTDRYRPASRSEAQELRERLRLPDSFLFLYVGRLAVGKGLPTLLDAWRRTSQLHERAHLVIVGSGQGMSLAIDDDLEQYVGDNGLSSCVTFTGHVDNVEDYMRAADCFVFPSESEGCPNSVIEAGACGLPCVASDVGGVPDIVIDGETGLLVTPLDTDRLASAMKRMALESDFLKICGRKARERILRNFDALKKVESFEAICSKLKVRQRANERD